MELAIVLPARIGVAVVPEGETKPREHLGVALVIFVVEDDDCMGSRHMRHRAFFLNFSRLGCVRTRRAITSWTTTSAVDEV